MGACDGALPLGVIIDAVAQLLGEEPAGLRLALLPTIRTAVVEGYLRGDQTSD